MWRAWLGSYDITTKEYVWLLSQAILGLTQFLAGTIVALVLSIPFRTFCEGL